MTTGTSKEKLKQRDKPQEKKRYERPALKKRGNLRQVAFGAPATMTSTAI